MKKILVIGSTVVDVIIDLVDHLPSTGEDVHVRSQRMSLGGCAFNVSDSIRHFEVPYILFSPVGTGVYGRFVRENLAERGLASPIPTPDMDNGCCYCFVESSGERSFVSYHGAEYRFQAEWFDLIDPSEVDSVYICGLEIEEETGPNIIAFLEKNPQLTVFFAPGPRLMRIRTDVLERLYRLHPILHLNETEALSVSGKPSIEEAARWLYQRTAATVIITLGENGCYYYDGRDEQTIPAFKAEQIDTIGAGDAHIGSVMACLKKGDTLAEAIRKANRVSASVVSSSGALLPEEEFRKLSL